MRISLYTKGVWCETNPTHTYFNIYVVLWIWAPSPRRGYLLRASRTSCDVSSTCARFGSLSALSAYLRLHHSRQKWYNCLRRTSFLVLPACFAAPTSLPAAYMLSLIAFRLPSSILERSTTNSLVVVQSNYLPKVSWQVAAKMNYKLRVPNGQ